MINNLDDILLELGYRVPGGIVDLTKDYQVTELVNILRENGYDDAFEMAQKARVYFSYLNETTTKVKPPTGMKWVKNRKSGNIYAVNNVDTQIHDIPTDDEVSKAKKSKKISSQDKEEPPVIKGTPVFQGTDTGVFDQPAPKTAFKPLKDDDEVEYDGKTITVAEARKIDDNKVLNALTKTIEQAEKEAADAKAKGEKLGIGAGSPASRAGECAVVHGAKRIKELMQSKGMSYADARKVVEKELRGYVKPNTMLTDAWVDAGMNTLDYIEQNIGFKNIKEYTWDTPDGRAICGTEGHGTSSDSFCLLNDGTRIGISLKKDLNVFVFNGGLADMLGSLKEQGMKLSDTSSIEHHKKRKAEELKKLANKITKDEETKKAFCKDFNTIKTDPSQIFGKQSSKRIQSIINSVYERPKRGEKDLRPKVNSNKPQNALKDINCNDVINHVVNGEMNGDNVSVIADIAKVSKNKNIRKGYSNLRGLDREMTDSLKEDFQKPENRQHVVELVKKETHINDVLFPNNSKLDELKVIYGEEPAIEMKQAQIIKLFGIQNDYDTYLKEKDPEKKQQIKQKINKIIDDKIRIKDKGGVMSIGIEVGKDNIVPVFDAKVRMRGLKASPTFEMPQSRFGGLAFKYGTTDFNQWSPEDREDAVTSMSKDLFDDLENLDMNDEKTKKEVFDRIKNLQQILPKDKNGKPINNRALSNVFKSAKYNM